MSSTPIFLGVRHIFFLLKMGLEAMIVNEKDVRTI